MSSPPPQSLHVSRCLIFLVLFILPCCCTSTRSGGTVIIADGLSPQRQHKLEVGIRYQAWVFNYFPKGTPIPPSGPSRGHNSVVDSVPHN
ncbi:hypothetical protein IFM89_030737 [Coptis chinensis]|uniref:Uncharacterized protein n=1 Tax=Coptis chinensis TaxID=261450 RepID=A0A835IZ65_9MAGN|nr:hypothetical protein IFM89_030737 [Coptis chinensis]